MNTSIQWLFIVLPSLVLLFYFYLVWGYNYWKKRGVHGPKPSPLIGNFPGLLNGSEHMACALDNFYQQYKGQNRFVGIYFGREPRLLILDPKLSRDIEISNFKSFQDNDIFFEVNPEVDPLIAQNPFFLRGNEWKEKRAEATPALTTSRIKASFPVMLEVCKKMRKYLEEKCQSFPPKDGIDVKDLSERYTAEVVANCVFGLEAGAFTKDECVIRDEGKRIIGTNEAAEFFWLFFSITFPLIKKFKKKQFVKKHTEEFFINLTHEAVKIREQSKIDRVDFLNYLIQLRDKKNLSDLQMAAHTLTFFVDGFETSSILMYHTIHMLAKYKNIQEKLRQEIKDAILKEGNLSFEKILELPYLDCVINETLRLYPPGPFVGKVCTEPYEFTNSNGKIFTMERGKVAILPIYSMQRDEEFYENAYKFIPERFSAENGGSKKYRDMGVFFPFGEGPRQCLGMRFALTQVKVGILELVLHWDMSVNPKTRKDFIPDPKTFLFIMDGGIWINFKRISGENFLY